MLLLQLIISLVLCRCKVDAINHWAKEVRKLEAAIGEARQRALRSEPTGSFFVFFNDQRSAATAAQVRHLLTQVGALLWLQVYTPSMIHSDTNNSHLCVQVSLQSEDGRQFRVTQVRSEGSPAPACHPDWYAAALFLGQLVWPGGQVFRQHAQQHDFDVCTGARPGGGELADAVGGLPRPQHPQPAGRHPHRHHDHLPHRHLCRCAAAGRPACMLPLVSLTHCNVLRQLKQLLMHMFMYCRQRLAADPPAVWLPAKHCRNRCAESSTEQGICRKAAAHSPVAQKPNAQGYQGHRSYCR